GVNNAVARAGSLFAVAALPVAVGLSGDEYADPTAFGDAFGRALLICAGLLAVGGLLSWFTIPAGPVVRPTRDEEHPPAIQLDCPEPGH
ncbi:MAG: MFS transporter, partial [Nocardioides sp.]